MGSKKKKKQALKEKKLKEQEAAAKSVKNKPKRDPKTYGVLLGLLIFVAISFLPSLDNLYVNWDDDKNFYENELVTTVNKTTFWSNSAEIFQSDVIGNYNPLTIWTFALEERMVSPKNRPYVRHLNNILLHVLCVMFVFWIGIRLKLGLWGAVFFALLFGVHPMRVESVAWVTERKDVLFGVFYLAALFQYIKGKQDGFSIGRNTLILVLFILSLLSKIQAVFLPISMILVDYYLSKNSKITFNSILSKWPYFIGSLIIGVVNIMTLKAQGSIEEQAYTGITRLFIGSYSLGVYYIKALIPYRLSPLYPYPASLNPMFYASILTFILTAAGLWFAYVKKWKAWFFGIAFFIANVFMLLQILGAGQGFIADRFTYIAYIGLFFIMAYYLNELITKKPKLKMVGLVGSSLVILGFAFMTFEQNKIWKDSASLWTHVLKYYENSTLPWGNRANHYRDTGQVQLALRDYAKRIRLKPNDPDPYNSVARLYFNFNQKDSLLKALYNYNKAIELKPTDVEFVVNRGATYAKLGDMQNSLKNLNQAEKIDPTFANIYLNRSVIYNQAGDHANALADIDRYLALKPNFPDMWYEKARLHNFRSEAPQAMEAINRAIGMNGRKGIYYFERAKVFYNQKNVAAARQDLGTSESLGFKGDPAVANRIRSGQ